MGVATDSSHQVTTVLVTWRKSASESEVSSSVIGYLVGPGAKRPTATSSPQSERPRDLHTPPHVMMASHYHHLSPQVVRVVLLISNGKMNTRVMELVSHRRQQVMPVLSGCMGYGIWDMGYGEWDIVHMGHTEDT